MPPRTDTRDKVLRTTAELFRAQGYHATGVNQVLAESGAPKGSMYFHFPGGKEQLAVEAIERAGSDLCSALAAAMSASPDPVVALEQVLAALGGHLEATDFREGCPIATVALDAAATSEPIRAACAGAYDSWQDVVAGHLRAAAVPAPDDVATVAIAAIEGALLLARTRRSLAPLHTVGAHLRLLLRSTP